MLWELIFEGCFNLFLFKTARTTAAASGRSSNGVAADRALPAKWWPGAIAGLRTARLVVLRSAAIALGGRRGYRGLAERARAATSTNTWAMACSPTSAGRERTRTMRSGRYARALSGARRVPGCRQATATGGAGRHRDRLGHGGGADRHGRGAGRSVVGETPNLTARLPLNPVPRGTLARVAIRHTAIARAAVRARQLYGALAPDTEISHEKGAGPGGQGAWLIDLGSVTVPEPAVRLYEAVLRPELRAWPSARVGRGKASARTAECWKSFRSRGAARW